MPTIVGLRRRGYTAEAIQLFAERTGVSKAGGWIDYASLDIALRDDLDPKAARAMAVLDPVKLVLTNWDAVMGAGAIDACSAPVHPAQPEPADAAPSASDARSGSSATTSCRRRPRATSASSPATGCA